MNEGKAAALYARFSTEMQNAKSVEDQQALCRAHAARLGVKVVAEYADHARTGATVHGRDGLADMLVAAKEGHFDLILVESLDRISRDQAELAEIHKRLTFAGVGIETVHEGRANTMLVGMRGIIGQMYLEDVRHKVRRGLVGVVSDGRNPGGRAYGYDPVKGEPGVLQIKDEEAAVIRRIFSDYANGKTPRQIAAELNAAGILPPRGTKWSASTINGNAKRGHGLLMNPLYSGEIVWNRTRMIRDPDTGKRVSRPNPESEWKRQPAPHLAIIDPELWRNVQDRKSSRSHARKEGAPILRKRHLFSGLLVCGDCGGKMVVKETDAKGRIRVHCSRARESGTCSNKASFYIDKIERFVAKVFQGWFETPDAGAALVEEILRKRSGATDPKKLEEDRRKLMEIEEQQRNLATVAAQTSASIPAVIQKLDELETLRQDVAAKLDAASTREPDEETLQWAVAAYMKLVENLPEIIRSLSGPSGALPETQPVREEIRGLFDRIIIHPGPPASIEPIAAIPLSTPRSPKKTGFGLVAEEGLEPPTRGL